MILRSLALSLFAFSMTLAHAADEGNIHLTIEGVRSDKGHVLVSVFDQADGFPMKPTKAVRVARLKAKNGSVTTGFSGLKAGDYAVAFVHDENDNHKLDKGNDGKTPKEGFGFSNSPKLHDGAADFEDAKFPLTTAGKDLKIKMTYLQ